VAGSQKVIGIWQLHTLDEFADVLRLQQVIWGFADAELLPIRFLVVVSKVGGHVFGAYDGREMVGFCFAIPGVKPAGLTVRSPQMPYLHSHMLGVLPAYHNAGIGRRLKLQQREEALSRGIQLIEWTFDPLELKNAYLNIEKLGAIVRRYYPNQYGTTSSPLHGGLPTDRCIAEWWIDSRRVRSILAGETEARNPKDARNPQERISYPADIARIRSEDNARARQIQQANADRFLRAFEDGLAVTGFARDEDEGTYLLDPWQKEQGQ
jgi:predicted GNAT superfamily acetyltransferase